MSDRSNNPFEAARELRARKPRPAPDCVNLQLLAAACELAAAGTGEPSLLQGRPQRIKRPPAWLIDDNAGQAEEETPDAHPAPKKRRVQAARSQEPSSPLHCTQRSDIALSAPPHQPPPSRSSRTTSSMAPAQSNDQHSGSGASTQTIAPGPLGNEQQAGSRQAANSGAAHPAAAPSIAAAIARKAPTKSMLSIMGLLMSIEAGGPIPESDIRKGLKDSPDISKALRELVKAGRVRKTGRGGRGHHKFHYAVTRQ